MTDWSSLKYFVLSNLFSQCILNILSYIPFTTLFYKLLFYFGLHTYYIYDVNIIRRVQKRLTPQCNIISDERGFGPVFGKWYYVSIRSDYVIIIANKDKYEKLTEEFHDEKTILQKSQITIYDRTGPYTHNWYDKRTIYIHSMQCWPKQEEIIDRILQQYNSKKHAVALLHGPPGSGKSMTGFHLTIQLKGNYCNVFKPWMPNTTLASLYTASTPSEDSPLILAMDEFDEPLLKIHNGDIPINEKLPTLITDKTGWNLFFDEIQRGMYPFVIIILTTNKSPQFFHDLDPSYIRKGRIDLIEEMNCR